MSQLFSHKENASPGAAAAGKSAAVSPTNRPLLSASSQNLSSAGAEGSSNTNIRSAIANLAPPPAPPAANGHFPSRIGG